MRDNYSSNSYNVRTLANGDYLSSIFMLSLYLSEYSTLSILLSIILDLFLPTEDYGDRNNLTGSYTVADLEAKNYKTYFVVDLLF